MDAPIILIAGIPSSAKSTSGCWLSKEKGFLHLDVEKNGVLREAGLQQLWDDIFEGCSVVPFTTAVKTHGKPAVINWGFPPDLLWVVEAFKVAKVEIWWFDGDRKIARAVQDNWMGCTSPAMSNITPPSAEVGWKPLPLVSIMTGEQCPELFLPGYGQYNADALPEPSGKRQQYQCENGGGRQNATATGAPISAKV